MLRGLSNTRFFLSGVLREIGAGAEEGGDAESGAAAADDGGSPGWRRTAAPDLDHGVRQHPRSAAGLRRWRRSGLHRSERRCQAPRRVRAGRDGSGVGVRGARQAADRLPGRRRLPRQGGGAAAQPSPRDRDAAAGRRADHPSRSAAGGGTGAKRRWSCSRMSTSSTTRSPSSRTRSGSSRPRTTTTRWSSTASTICSVPRTSCRFGPRAASAGRSSASTRSRPRPNWTRSTGSGRSVRRSRASRRSCGRSRVRSPSATRLSFRGSCRKK